MLQLVVRLLLLLLLLLLCIASRPVVGFTNGMLPNGDFETGPSQSQMRGTEVIDPHAIPHWQLSGFVEYISSGGKQGDMLLVVPEGHSAVRLGNEASIKQLVNVTKGMHYSLTFSAARTCGQDEKLNVSVTPESGTLPIQTVYSSDGWDVYAWAFQAKFAAVDVVIHNPGQEEDPACGPLIDAVAIASLFPPKRSNTNILKNGDFEEGPYMLPNISRGILIPPNVEDDHSPLPGWVVESLKAVKYIDIGHYTVPKGRRAVQLLAGMESALAQVARTIPGKTYVLTFAVGDAGDECGGQMEVRAYAGSGTAKIPYVSTGKGGLKRALLKFTAVTERTRVLFMSSYYNTKSDGTLCGPIVDDVVLVSVRGSRR